MRFSDINKEFDVWMHQEPNIINKGSGFITKPLEFLLKPFIKFVEPLLTGVIKGLNNFIADAMSSRTEANDVVSLSLEDFDKWFKEADKSARNWVTGGITALSVEGAGAGIGGFLFLAADIPASFSLILGFANRIALAYQLDISSEDVQIELLKAISLGTEYSIEGKLEAAASLRAVAKIIEKQSWKSMANADVKSMAGLISSIRNILQKMGVNITKRKAGQIIPVIGSAVGAVINGAWASDTLEAVRQFARYSIVKTYCEKNNIPIKED